MNPAIVTLKAFGDFVIACSAAKRVHSAMTRVTPTVVAGGHVRGLALAMGLETRVKLIGDESWIDVPAAFDMRKKGLLSALRSLNNLHLLLDKLPADIEPVFDRFGWRELYIGRGRLCRRLPADSGNIYVAYDRFFESLGYDILNDALGPRRAINTAVIIPGARSKSRVIPPSVILNIVEELAGRGIDAFVLVLEGELIGVPSGVCIKKIPRSFGDLVAIVKSADIVISADSLPGHLSEFFSIPIFVFTPMPKHTKYWLPRSAYQTKGWATFSDMSSFRSWLNT